MGDADPPFCKRSVWLVVSERNPRCRGVSYTFLRRLPIHVRLISEFFLIRVLITSALSWVYSSTLAYIVDANVGRSTTAVACNSAFRGTTAFIFAEVAVPLQNSIGDCGLYTLWAGLLGIVGLLIMLLIWKGKEWRERDLLKSSEK